MPTARPPPDRHSARPHAQLPRGGRHPARTAARRLPPPPPHHPDRPGPRRLRGGGRGGHRLADAPRLGRPGAQPRRCGPSPVPGSRSRSGSARCAFTAPCEVVWTAYERDRTGFALRHRDRASRVRRGVVRGRHPATTARCGSPSWPSAVRPSWYTRLAGPLVPVLQKRYAQRLGSHGADGSAAADTGGDGVVHATATTG